MRWRPFPTAILILRAFEICNFYYIYASNVAMAWSRQLLARRGVCSGLRVRKSLQFYFCVDSSGLGRGGDPRLFGRSIGCGDTIPYSLPVWCIVIGS